VSGGITKEKSERTLILDELDKQADKCTRTKVNSSISNCESGNKDWRASGGIKLTKTKEWYKQDLLMYASERASIFVLNRWPIVNRH
jgi:hypothetical protein